MPEEKKRFGFSEGILVIFIPAVAYAIGFSYEEGYLKFFGIPSALISVDIPSMFSAVIFGAFYIFLLLLWLFKTSELLQDNQNSKKTIGLAMVLGFFIILFLLTKGTQYYIYIFLSLALIGVLTVILSKLESKFNPVAKIFSVTYKLINGTIKKDIEDETHSSAANIPGKIFVLFIFLLIPFFVSSLAGSNNAREKITFDTIEHEKLGNIAIVRIYGDLVIGVPFTQTDKTLKGKYIVLDIKSLQNTPFVTQDIGPFKEREKTNKHVQPPP